MEPELSLQIIWPLAAKEAIVAEFKYIEPPHLLNAVLKFAEFNEEQLAEIVREPTAVKMLATECEAVRDELEQYSIGVPDLSTRIRRGLRKHLGRGGHPMEKEQAIHRSDASRKVFSTAEDMAGKAGKHRWGAANLLQALIESPTSEIARVLEQEGIGIVKPTVETPFLDEYGRDLTASALEAQQSPASDRDVDPSKDPICKVITDEIVRSKKRHVLLIQAGERSPKAVVETLVQMLIGDSAPKNAKGMRIIELPFSKLIKGARKKGKPEEVMAGILRESSQSGNVILWLSDFHHYLLPEGETDLAQLLKKSSPSRKTPFIASTNKEGYVECVEPDRELKRLFHKVWIHDIEAPLQL